MPLSCRHPFGLAFVLGASLGVSCWAVRSPSLVVRGQGLVVPVEMLPLLRSTESLPLITAMLQFLGPRNKKDRKPSSSKQAGKCINKEDTFKTLGNEGCCRNHEPVSAGGGAATTEPPPLPVSSVLTGCFLYSTSPLSSCCLFFPQQRRYQQHLSTSKLGVMGKMKGDTRGKQVCMLK